MTSRAVPILTLLAIALAVAAARFTFPGDGRFELVGIAAIGAALAAVSTGAVRSAGRGLRLALLSAGAAAGPPLGGARMTGRLRALWRLLGVQAAWNYERMQGIGMGHAAEPVLEELGE